MQPYHQRETRISTQRMGRACRRRGTLSRGRWRSDAPTPDFARRAVDLRRHDRRDQANGARQPAARLPEGQGSRKAGPEATRGAAAPRYGRTRRHAPEPQTTAAVTPDSRTTTDPRPYLSAQPRGVGGRSESGVGGSFHLRNLPPIKRLTIGDNRY